MVKASLLQDEDCEEFIELLDVLESVYEEEGLESLPEIEILRQDGTEVY